jgi:hypothetical protein
MRNAFIFLKRKLPKKHNEFTSGCLGLTLPMCRFFCSAANLLGIGVLAVIVYQD